MKKIQLKTLAMIIFIAANIQIKGQDANNRSKAWGGIGYFETGITYFDYSDINKLFKNAGFPELTTPSISMGGGGHALIANFIVGGEGHGYFGAISQNDQYKVSHGGGYGFFNVGYLLMNTPTTKLYPMVGLGGGSVTVSITDRNQIPDSFDQILLNPARQSHIYTGGFTMNFSLSSDFFVAGQRTEQVSGGFFVGIRAGYTLQLSGNNWYLDEQILSDSPNSGMSGPYVRLTIGGGGISNN